MAHYKVIALSLHIAGNFYKSGNIVTEKQIGSNERAKDLVDKKFLQKMTQKEVDELTKAKAKVEAGAKSESDKKDEVAKDESKTAKKADKPSAQPTSK